MSDRAHIPKIEIDQLGEVVRCNHCGESFICHIDNAAFPCCAKCTKAGHVRAVHGCPVCRDRLDEDLRQIVDNRQLDIGFFDN